VKTVLQENKFCDAEDIKKNVTAQLNAVPLEAFSDCLQKPFERFNTYNQVGEDYFE
jgi:hypothetical protein